MNDAHSPASLRPTDDRHDPSIQLALNEPTYSVVIPFFNEEPNAAALLAEVSAVMQRLGSPYELILVNDGSTDGTSRTLLDHVDDHGARCVLELPANHGQAFALYAGIRIARAPVVITLDGDGQNDPADIPLLLASLPDADMVVGVRVQRCDSFLRRALSTGANAVRRRLLGDGVDDSGCALKVFRRSVIPFILPLRTLYSFLPAMAVAGGLTVAQHPVSHRARSAGTSSYGLRGFLWRPLVDTVGLWWFRRRSFAPRRLQDEIRIAHHDLARRGG